LSEALSPTTIKELCEISDSPWIYIHGTRDGYLLVNGEPDPDEYKNSLPPEKWQDKVRYVIENLPNIAVGRVLQGELIYSNQFWSGIGLIIKNGDILGTGAHRRDINGDLVPYDQGRDEFIYPADRNSCGLYELAVSQPEIKGLYFLPNTPAQDIQKVCAIADEYNLPVYTFDINTRPFVYQQAIKE